MLVPHLLSLLIWLPVLGAVLVLAFGRQPDVARWLTLVISLTTFVLSLFLWADYVPTGAVMQFLESTPWIPALKANYALGADGISIALIVMSTFTTVLAIIGAWSPIKQRVSQFMASMLMLEAFLIGVFSTTDALLFYVFFEAMLIPMFIIIGIWGGPRRVYATLKFFIYTFFGSIFMLIALIYLHLKTGEFSLAAFAAAPLSAKEQMWLFFAFFAGFAIKVPMWPVHTWLPDAHVEAPTGGSVILAAVMLKVGGYGFIRFSLPITPDASQEFAWLVIAFSLIAIIYIGYVALVQPDMKKLVAYTSVTHMGFVTLGIFSFNPQGFQGAVITMFSHGLVTGGLFLCVGVLYERAHTRQISAFGGIANRMPTYASVFMVFMLAALGLPGLSGFVGEYLSTLGSFRLGNKAYAAITMFVVIFAAVYMMWMYKRVIFGEPREEHNGFPDLTRIEMSALLPLALAVLYVGIYPVPIMKLLKPVIGALLAPIVGGGTAAAAADSIP